MTPFFDYKIPRGDLDLNVDFADLKILQIFRDEVLEDFLVFNADPEIYI